MQKRFAIAAVLVIGVSLAACGGKPFEAPDISDIPDGPGVFSGSDGEFVISPKRRVRRR